MRNRRYIQPNHPVCAAHWSGLGAKLGWATRVGWKSRSFAKNV